MVGGVGAFRGAQLDLGSAARNMRAPVNPTAAASPAARVILLIVDLQDKSPASFRIISAGHMGRLP